MSRFIIGSLINKKNIFGNPKRKLLTPIEHIEKTDLNIVPFFLVLSLSGTLWAWESYQNVQQLRHKVNSFQSILEKCLQENQSCDYVEDTLNSLLTLDCPQKKSSMLVRVNTKSNQQLELSQQQKPSNNLPIVNDESQ